MWSKVDNNGFQIWDQCTIIAEDNRSEVFPAITAGSSVVDMLKIKKKRKNKVVCSDSFMTFQTLNRQTTCNPHISFPAHIMQWSYDFSAEIFVKVEGRETFNNYVVL